jgi:hypothetical protein
MITKEQLREYAQIKAQLKALTAQEATLKKDILVTMSDEGAEKIDTEFGTFSLAKRKSWTYPQSIVEMQADLKVAMKTAEAKGEATYEENPYFVFKEAKTEE